MSSPTSNVPLPNVSAPVATAAVVLASVGFGTVPYFARGLTEAGMAPHAVAFFRYVIAAIVFLPAVWAARRKPVALAWGLGTGFAVGLGWMSYVAALEVLPVATVGVIYMTFPVFTLLASFLLFRERPMMRGLAAAAVVGLAAVLAAGPAALAPASAPILLAAFASPATFGLAIAVLVHRLPAIPALARLGVFAIGSAIGLAPLVALTPREEVMVADPAVIQLVIGIALLTALVPQLLYAVFAPVIGAARASIAGAVELPTMLVIGWLAWGETLTLAQAVAATMIVSAVALSPSRKVRNVGLMAALPEGRVRRKRP